MLPDTGAVETPSNAAQRFAEIAARFCTFIDEAQFQNKPAARRVLAGLLAELYGYGLALLPLPSDPDVESVADEGLTFEDWTVIFNKVADLFGEHDTYWELFDPYTHEEPVGSSLSDDISDLYRDLKNGLALFERGDVAGYDEAVWNWRWGFLNHWGDHLVDALRALHRVIRNEANDK